MINFSKMQGLGNDFIIIDGRHSVQEDYKDLAKRMCHRNFGVGADGLIVIKHSKIADIKMKHYNSDGSEASMCGNGIRCLSKFLFHKGIIKKGSFKIETLGGIMEPSLDIENGIVSSIRVNMGRPIFDAELIPVKTIENEFIDRPVENSKGVVSVSAVKVGASHGIIFCEELRDEDVTTVGRELECHDYFPDRININFVKVLSKNSIKIKTWERGAGQTLACGTGACASAVMGMRVLGLEKVCKVELDGGNLTVELCETGNIIMEGKAEFICDGQYYEI